MATVRLENLRKEFDAGSIVAVDDISIAVDDGEFLTVVGPSGCGKSTTLRMVAGLERPTAGRIIIGDRDVTDRHARHRDIAMVFQNYALYPHKTVYGNMEFGLRMSTDLSKPERREKVLWAAEMMGIEELLEQKPDELSGGQKQRVALGRSIVREPEVFLFDEPLSNLDAKLRVQMRAEIQRLQDELGITSIYVTHDQEEAMTMGDRMAILRDGELQQIGDPTTVYENPANRFVAGFIGSPSMNFIEVGATSAAGGGTRLIAENGAFEYTMEASMGDAVESHQPLMVGIRPEDVEVSDGGLPTTVEVVEPVGADNYLYVDLGPNFILRVDSSVEPRVGETIYVDFDEADLHLFAEDGRSLLVDAEAQASATA